MSTPEETVQSPALMLKITGIAFIVVFLVYIFMSLTSGLMVALYSVASLFGDGGIAAGAFTAIWGLITIGGAIVVNIVAAGIGYQIFDAGNKLASLEDQSRVQLAAILAVVTPVVAGGLNFGLSMMSFSLTGCCTSFFPQILLLALGAITALMVFQALQDEAVTRALDALDAQ